jgi:hypothetical protein
VAAEDLGAEPLGLRAHLPHQLRPHDAVAMPGQFSTSVVSISCPPASSPSMTSGFRLARAV